LFCVFCSLFFTGYVMIVIKVGGGTGMDYDALCAELA
jgi:hypothetical protein